MKYVTKTFTVEIVLDGWDMNMPLRSSEDVWHWAKPLYATLDADKEHFVLIVQNNKNKVEGHKVISTGTLTASLVHPREVYTAVLSPEWRAAAIIFLHNHPSGDPQPSQDDLEITRRIKEGAEIMMIRFLDHIILGNGRFYSFSDRKSLERELEDCDRVAKRIERRERLRARNKRKINLSSQNRRETPTWRKMNLTQKDHRGRFR